MGVLLKIDHLLSYGHWYFSQGLSLWSLARKVLIIDSARRVPPSTWVHVQLTRKGKHSFQPHHYPSPASLLCGPWVADEQLKVHRGDWLRFGLYNGCWRALFVQAIDLQLTFNRQHWNCDKREEERWIRESKYDIYSIVLLMLTSFSCLRFGLPFSRLGHMCIQMKQVCFGCITTIF